MKKLSKKQQEIFDKGYVKGWSDCHWEYGSSISRMDKWIDSAVSLKNAMIDRYNNAKGIVNSNE